MSRRETLILLLTFSSPLLPAQDVPLGRVSAAIPIAAAVQGRVVNPKGRPLAGTHIELDEARTALPVMSTFTHADGTFELYNIPNGEYEIVAESADAEVSDTVTVDRRSRALELRFPPPTISVRDQSTTVSVAQILAPEKAQKLYRRAREAFVQNDYKSATTLVQQALQVEPNYADALTLQGLIELGNSDPHVPQRSLENALRLNPNDSYAGIALAAIYNALSRSSEALTLAKRAASLNPKSWQAHLEIAKAWIAQNMFTEGLTAIRQAERLGGTRQPEVHLVKAIGLFHMKYYRESKYEAQAAIARDHSTSCSERARSLIAQMEAEQAVLALDR
jgi:tetratricopeptide (TPR) repeat protein